MDKFMYIFDFEFKRNLKNYINIISMFCFAFIIEVVNHLINYNEIAGKALRGILTVYLKMYIYN